MSTTIVIAAKAPVAGQVKTRLAVDVGDAMAADLAAAALLDTIAACTEAVGPSRCRLALAGSLAASARLPALTRALAGWTIVAQRGDGLAERLAHAHQQVTGPLIQLGMDTPQVSPAALLDLARALADHDAVLAPAEDGGWWALGLATGRHGRLLRGVPMSTPTTYDATLTALRAAGLRIATATMLIDADHLPDARRIAAVAPATRFARTLAAFESEAPTR